MEGRDIVGSPVAQPGEGLKVTPHLLGLEGGQGDWYWNVRPKDKSRGVRSPGSQDTACTTGPALLPRVTQTEGPATQCQQEWAGEFPLDRPGGWLVCVTRLGGAPYGTGDASLGRILLKAGPEGRW